MDINPRNTQLESFALEYQFYHISNQGVCRMNRCTMMVLDEADKLLSQDFKNMLDDVIGFLPNDRQIMLYSATFPLTVDNFVVSIS